MFRTLLTTTILSLAVSVAFAQTYKFERGTATPTANLFGNQQARHTQQLYLPGDILDSTLAPMQVNKIYFKRDNTSGISNNSSNLDTLKIYMAESTKRTFPTVFSPRYGSFFIKPSTMQKVVSQANVVVPGGATGWFSFDLPTPYTLNPAMPLALDVQFVGVNNNSSFSVSGLGRFGIGVYYRVTSASLTDSIGSNSSSTVPYFGIDIVTATKPNKVFTVKPYPNPASHSFELQLPNPTPATATLIATNGRKIALGTQSGWDKWALPAELASGLYSVMVEQGGISYTTRLLVQ